MFDFVGKRYWTFLLSALVILLGLISLLIFGLRFSIDFTGGSLLELQFHEAVGIEPAQVKAVFDGHGLSGTLVQTSGEDTVLVRTSGTYSSLFIAAPLLVVWENGEVGRFFRRLRRQEAPA